MPRNKQADIVRKRVRQAACLLCLFVSGSLLAPLAHYSFMVISDAYAPLDAQTHPPHHHHSEDQGTGYQVAQTHFMCQYADLFANFNATEHVQTLALDAPVHPEALLVFAQHIVSKQGIRFFQSRAPPLR